MKRMPAPLMARTELTMERIAMVRNHPAPALTTRSARNFCSTKFVREGCGVELKPKLGDDIAFLRLLILVLAGKVGSHATTGRCRLNLRGALLLSNFDEPFGQGQDFPDVQSGNATLVQRARTFC